jgi:DNA-binding GntR family transcriptional regulator
LLIRQHRAILKAAIARDAGTAEQIVRAHLSIVVETTIELMRINPDLINDDANEN